MFPKSEDPVRHIPGTITLLANPIVSQLNDQLSNVYSEMADRYFRGDLNSELHQRIRAYDNHQRFTFGRAQSQPIPCSDLVSGIDAGALKRLDRDGLDESYFPGELADGLYGPLLEAVRFTAATLLADSNYSPAESAMVTVFCHRVLVRPQERYRGFFHRDLAPRSGRIGTIIWYPEIRHELVEGLDFVAYSAMPEVSLKTLSSQEPDYLFRPSEYAKSALILGYPHNYAHGVRTGVNLADSGSLQERQVQDFISPLPEYFIKDLVIITVSEWSPVED